MSARRTRRRARAVTLLTGLFIAASAAPAAADPAGPTNYRSTVTGIDPAAAGIAVDVLGGDAYVELTAAPGVSVEVAGYDGEPYLRFSPDGTVERSESSPTRWINDARYGLAAEEVPHEASVEAPPRWQVVADDGVYAWHDHRVHWMSPGLPPNVVGGAGEVQPVNAWELPITVDGDPVVVQGQLVWVPSVSPIPAVLVALAAFAAGLLVALRRTALLPAVPVVGALAGGVVGLAGTIGLPPGADTDPAHLLLPGVSLALVVLGRAVRRRPGLGAALVTPLAGVPLVVLSVLLLRALIAPIVPTLLPDLVARVLVAVTLGAGVASLVAASRLVLTPAASAEPAPAVT